MSNEIMFIRNESLATPALEEIRVKVSNLCKTVDGTKYAIAYTIGTADNVIDGNVDGFTSYETFCKSVFGLAKTQSSTYHNVAQLIRPIYADESKSRIKAYTDFVHDNPAERFSISILIELLPLLKSRTVAEIKALFDDGTISGDLSARKMRERVKEIINPDTIPTKKTNKKKGSDVGTGTGEGTGEGTETDKGTKTEVPTISVKIPAWFVQKELIPEMSRYIEESTALKLLYGAINEAMKTPGGAITLNVNPPEEPVTLDDAIKAVEG